MSDPTGPAALAPAKGALPCHPTPEVLPSVAADQDPSVLVGGPALSGWDSELEEARHIGTLR